MGIVLWAGSPNQGLLASWGTKLEASVMKQHSLRFQLTLSLWS